MPEDTLEPKDVSGEEATEAVESAEETAAELTEESAEAEVPATEAPAASSDAGDEAPATEDEVRAQLLGLPGRWYVLHTYSGYEKRVKQDLEVRIQTMNMEDFIFQIEVPMESVFEIRRGQRKLVSRVRMPGYVVIRMDMTDDAWRVVQSTNGVTGFVGNGRTPVALTPDEVVKMLTPVIEAEAAAQAVAAGLPTGSQPETISPFEVGESVTLTSEPWAGMPATVSSVDTVNQRLTVLMTLVGQETPVELAFNQIRKED
ncbi:transcription termination/antitermination protein NusG [Changpingibacter yushuensis]|uniref:transcription termination/antitermination protein NusG n=1 Tax=Changpingibacter yushuensis TaxID=2758440 RepID=UPI00165E50DC|nr:transcription termination/antitermination protein NusG [Changpingibacter yushuensis]